MTSTAMSRGAPLNNEDDDRLVRDGDEVYALGAPKQEDIYRESSDTAWSRESESRVTGSSGGKEVVSVNAEKIGAESLAGVDGRAEGTVAYELCDLIA